MNGRKRRGGRRVHFLDYRRERMCTRKTPFSTEADALACGAEAYHCPYCGDYHATSHSRPYS